MVIHTPNNGRAFAKNIGINAASTNILIFNDADRIPSSNFVEKHIMHHNEGRKIVVGNPQNFLGKSVGIGTYKMKFEEKSKKSLYIITN